MGPADDSSLLRVAPFALNGTTLHGQEAPNLLSWRRKRLRPCDTALRPATKERSPGTSEKLLAGARAPNR